MMNIIKKISYLYIFIAFALTGCGGNGQDNKQAGTASSHPTSISHSSKSSIGSSQVNVKNSSVVPKISSSLKSSVSVASLSLFVNISSMSAGQDESHMFSSSSSFGVSSLFASVISYSSSSFGISSSISSGVSRSSTSLSVSSSISSGVSRSSSSLSVSSSIASSISRSASSLSSLLSSKSSSKSSVSVVLERLVVTVNYNFIAHKESFSASVGDVAYAYVEGFYSDGSSGRIKDVVWDKIPNDVASIDASGKITMKGMGHALIGVQGKFGSPINITSNVLDVTIENSPTNISFHLLKPASWKNTVKAHWWATKTFLPIAEINTFPGVDMKDSDGDGWYDININNGSEANILFDDGGAASAGFKQTTDQYARRGGWFVPDEFPNKDGKYYGTWYDAKPELSAQKICDVTHYQALGDGKKINTKEIQAAIDDCAGKNGIVILRDGKFVTGTIELKSDMTLRIEPTASLLGSQNVNDYPQQPKLSINGVKGVNGQYLNCRQALIYSEKAKNIRIDGGGVIDARGETGSPWLNDQKPTQESPNPVYAEANRPMAIFLVQTEGIVLQNVTVKNSAMWSVVPFESSNVIIRGVTVESSDGRTRDGIDPVDCHHVLIEDVDVRTTDDSICFKSGSTTGVVDALVRYSRVHHSGANGLKFGTATSGPFRDVSFTEITVEDVNKSGVAVESVDGSNISNINFNNIFMKKIGTPFYIVLGDRGAKNVNDVNPGSIDNLRFENIIATDTTKTWGSFISGLRSADKVYKLTNLTFKNIDVTFKGGSTNFAAQPEYNENYAGEYPDPGNSRDKNGDVIKKDMPGYLFFRHVDNLTLTNVKVNVTTADGRPKIVKEDVSHVITN